jgi:uncharacterized NAD(P)/FAD-binding protein YdhS
MAATAYDIVIVGGGFSGAALLIELSRQLRSGRVAIISRPGELGRGLAYRASNDDLYLNVPAGKLSLHPDREDDFRVVATDCGELDEHGFASRAAYGRYVEGKVRAAIVASTGRVKIDVVEDTADAIRKARGEYQLTLQGGGRLSASAVVLCLGNAPPQFRIPSAAIEPGAEVRMIADPWNDPRIDAIGAGDRVLLVGAGLTMVDQIVRLDRRGHHGPMTAISRHGRLPAAHLPEFSAPASPHLPPRSGLLPLFRAVARAVRAADAAGEDWRAVIDGLRPVTQQLWQGLSIREQRSFLRHVESYWNVGRHRMAPLVASRLNVIRLAREVELLAARVIAVRAAGEAVDVTLRPRGGSGLRAAAFDWIINCTGPGRFPSLVLNPVVASLVEAGLARPDGLAMGLDVDDEYRLMAAGGAPSPSLFALGPPTAGRFFEITAVREIRQQAADLAGRLAA